MTPAEKIVEVLIGTGEPEPTTVIDPRQHPDLYTVGYRDNGQDVFKACAWCEAERFPGRRQFAHGATVSHGICPRHQQEMRAQFKKTSFASPPKATFWPTSGSLA